MKSKLTTAFSVIALIVVACPRGFAEGVFNLTDSSLQIIEVDGVYEVVNGPIYATLKLTGDSPYDHTNIASLTFTPEGESILGYTGRYSGIFDSSGVTLSEDSFGRLMVDSVIDKPILSLSWIDDDAPESNRPDSSQVLSQSLAIQTLSTHSSIILYQKVSAGNGLTLPGERLRTLFPLPTISGTWVRAIPEPSTILLAVCTALLCTGFRPVYCLASP